MLSWLLQHLMRPPQVKRTYSQGTYRAGAMRQVSLVGAVDEEVGDYFPEFIRMLEDSPFLEVGILSFIHSSPFSRGCLVHFHGKLTWGDLERIRMNAFNLVYFLFISNHSYKSLRVPMKMFQL